MQSMTDYEQWRDSLHDRPRPDEGPDERNIRYFTHDYTADTRLEFTRTGQRSELTLSFSSEDPDMGTEEMIYAGENGESMHELVTDLHAELTGYLDAADSSSFALQQGLEAELGIHDAADYYGEYSRTALYAFESALQAMERDLRENLPWQPVQADQESWLYSADRNADLERGCVGHLRGDFGHGGKEFWTSWFDHQPGLNTTAFSAELKDVMTGLRRSGHLLSDFETMRRTCQRGRPCDDSFGFHAETPRYEYCLRCTPRRDDYNFYLYIYDKVARREHTLTQAADKTLTTPVEPVKPDRHADKQKGMDR